MQNAPIIANPWMRVLFFLTLGLISTTLIITLFEAILQKGWLGFSTTTLLPEISTTIFYCIQQLATIAAVFFTIKYIDAKPFLSIGLQKFSIKEVLLGAFVAGAILIIGFIWLRIENYLQIIGNQFKPISFFCGLILFLIVAFSEEIMLRGYILNNLMQATNKWIALLISSLVFCAFHLGNPNINGVAILNIFLAGILLGVNYMYTKNLYFAIALHFVWNFFQGPILGYAVSGLLPNNGVIISQVNGSSIITGGLFGFEGSIFCTILQVLTIALLIVFFEKKYSTPKNHCLEVA